MIGGYIYSRKDEDIEARLKAVMRPDWPCLKVWEHGFFFYTNPFHAEQSLCWTRGDAVGLSEDLLVTRDGSGCYRLLDIDHDFAGRWPGQAPEAFGSIQNDFRMAVACNRGGEPLLFLASHRAGSGRIYYHRLKTGIIFCSDLRLLLKIVPFQVSRMAVYAILKYGSAPEPLTISENVLAVPAAHFLRYDILGGGESVAPYFKYGFAEGGLPPLPDTDSALAPVRDVLRNTAKFLGQYPTAMLLSGGIDSSLLGCYLNEGKAAPLEGFYCSFGSEDPEREFASRIAGRLGVSLQVATMGRSDAMVALDNVVRLTDHPFSDYSSLPIAFLLQFVRHHQRPGAMIIECNGGDDCFGFGYLGEERKFRLKHSFPYFLKKTIVRMLGSSTLWKWEASEGALARVAALADVHEKSVLNYFLVMAPVNYLGLDRPSSWDDALQEMIEKTAASCTQGHDALGYEAKTTVRQLLYVNSARWAAKALSVGESLETRVVYPYIWHDVLIEQGKLPWDAKIHNGIVKWPLRRLLEEFMPRDFIYRKKSGFVPPFARWLTDVEFNDRAGATLLNRNGFVSEVIPRRVLKELLADAREGKRLRFPILNTLWGALFTEAWIREQKSGSPLSARQTSGVTPGTATGSTILGPNSYLAGDRSSLEASIAHSQDIARPV
jgi:asparagine synthase (glutamine-hydrolysing)